MDGERAETKSPRRIPRGNLSAPRHPYQHRRHRRRPDTRHLHRMNSTSWHITDEAFVPFTFFSYHPKHVIEQNSCSM